MNGSICGGVISLSQHKKNMRKNIWADMMAFIMPDKQYTRFIKLKQQGKEKEAQKVFDRYAISQI